MRALAIRTWLARVAWVETTLAMALLSGWGLLVWGIGELVAPWLSARGVWAIGAGLLLLGSCGFKYLSALVRHGLYALSQVRE